MNTKADQIETLLHELRNPSASFDKVLEFSAATRDASPDEIALGVHKFTRGMLAAARNVLQLQADSAEAK